MEIPQRNHRNYTAMAKKQTFEEAIRQLEEITRQLEEGDISLEASIKKFEEGMKLSEFCSQKLEEARQKITLLLKKDGDLEERPFNPSRTE